MALRVVRFGPFRLDPADRRLIRNGAPLELNARYFDALVLLVGNPGQLVSKDRFLDDVWRGVPVTDEALTQCIKTLRKLLGDDASKPRFIETVPKHGYRFIATVSGAGDDPDPRSAPPSPGYAWDWRQFVQLGSAGTIGGGFAGLSGGLLYGFGGGSQPLQPGTSEASTLLVLVCLSILVALIGAAGVAFGIAAAGFARARSGWLTIVGGAGGGLVVGACTKLLGLDAFNLLFGQSPGDITGAGEGALLGGAVGLGAWLASRGASPASLGRGLGLAALTGGVGGVTVTLAGGKLMGGSLDLLARQFLGSRLSLDPLGALFGESGFGPISRLVTGGIEGLLFGGFIVAAMMIARQGIAGGDQAPRRAHSGAAPRVVSLHRD